MKKTILLSQKEDIQLNQVYASSVKSSLHEVVSYLWYSSLLDMFDFDDPRSLSPMFSQGFFYFLYEKIDWLRFFILCLACLFCNLEIISTQQFSHGKRNPSEIMEHVTRGI